MSSILEQVIAPLIILVIWFVLMRYVLPRFGVSTGLKGSCHVEFPRQEDSDVIEEEQS